MGKTILVVCWFQCLSALALAGSAEPSVLAVLEGTGKRKPATEVVLLLEVALGKRPGIALVERALINKILEEQELTALSPGDSRTSVRLGELLGAKALLHVEKVGQSGVRVRLVETATGIILGQEIMGRKSLDDAPGEMADAVARILAKTDIPADKRVYIGAIECRDETLTRELVGTADAMAMLISAGLGANSNTVLLDREQTQQLTAEHALTGIAQKLMAAAVTVNGGIDRNYKTRDLKLSLALTSLAKRSEHAIRLQAPENDLAGLRTRAVAAILAKLNAAKTAGPPPDRKAEAATYARRAQVLATAWRQVLTPAPYLPAIRSFRNQTNMAMASRLAEAAYALDPSQTNRWLAASFAEPPPRHGPVSCILEPQVRCPQTDGGPDPGAGAGRLSSPCRSVRLPPWSEGPSFHTGNAAHDAPDHGHGNGLGSIRSRMRQSMVLVAAHEGAQ